MTAMCFLPPIIWDDPNLIVWTWCGGLFQVLSIIILYVFALEPSEIDQLVNPLIEERFECILLIGIGEIVAAFVGNATFSPDVFHL